MQVSRSSYFMLSHGHPIVIPNIHTTTCDICGNVEMNDDLYFGMIDFHTAKDPDHRLQKYADSFDNLSDKKQK